MLKLLLIAVAVSLVVIVAVVAVGAFSVFSSLTGEPEPLSQELIARGQAVEKKIEEAVTDKAAFYLELTDDELSDLLLYRAASVSAIRDIGVSISPGSISIDGSLGSTPSLPFSGTIDVAFVDGLINMDLRDVSLSFLPVPGALQEQLQPLIDKGLDINQALSDSGAAQIQKFDLQPGKAVIVGVQRGGASVSAATVESFAQAYQAAGNKIAPTPPGSDVVPRGSAGISKPGPDLYLALGDSLAANVGVNQPQDGYVSRFHAHLEQQTGRDLGLLNLGISGESSISIMTGQFQQAMEEIRRRRDDGDPDTRVSILTIDLGANDLLTHLGSTECHLAPIGSACQARIDAGLQGFAANFPDIVGPLAKELDADAEFYIMTMYNPFDFGLGIPFEDFSNDIVARLNAIIAENANNVGARLADPYALLGGNAAAWTNILRGDIHPNPDGYQALAFSLAQAR
ncbi:MAG: SGNH/GDSL hydrolase family protein [Chloroflexi bacterium]|nr:SGNH/GDSL hydrolase family protein [Chloroflexota bacterium]